LVTSSIWFAINYPTRSTVLQQKLVNSTVSSNVAATAGGGIYTHYNGTVTLVSSTIVSNTAGFAGGGGITYGGTINVKNTMIAGNTKAGGSASDCSATLTSQGYNLIQDTTGCTITGDTTGNQTGVNPNLGPLGNNGGPTLTHVLLFGSPAIDGGNPSGCTDHTGSTLTSDQRGFPRAADGDDNGTAICDIGAYEFWVPSDWTYLPLIQR
jgi:predicted outer membrane repeat protein